MSSFWLEYMQDGQRREFSFDSHTVSIGRDKASDFVLDHPTVSRQHARIQFGHQGPQLVVLSRGGLTALDGNQVQGEVSLFDGSEIHFGQLSFTFRSNDAPRRAATNGTNGWQQSAPQNGQSGHFDPPAQQSGTDWSKQSGTDWSKQSGTDWSKQSGTDWSAASASGEAAAPSAGGWDNIPVEEPQSDGGIVSWDQIAQSVEEEESYAKQGVTDFEKMQQARAKLEQKSKGTNPVLVGVALIGIAGLLGWTFFGGKVVGTGADGPDKVDPLSLPVVSWLDSDIDCVGRAACEQAALDSYKVGKSTYEQREADLTNLYTAYSQLDRASKYVEKGEVTPIPAELADLEGTKKKLEGEMDTKFQGYRVKYLDQKKKKQYRDMVDTLNHVYAYFPDKRSRYNKWANEQELSMKSAGVYPPAPRF